MECILKDVSSNKKLYFFFSTKQITLIVLSQEYSTKHKMFALYQKQFLVHSIIILLLSSADMNMI